MCRFTKYRFQAISGIGATGMQRQEFLSKWLEIIKKSSAVLVYKQDLINRLLTAIRNSATRHTYDPAWARALVAEVEGAEEVPGRGETEIELRSTAASMIKYYWDQTVFFGLIQGSNPCRQPDLIRRVRDLAGDYYKNRRPWDPVRFENANFNPYLKEKLEANIDAAAEMLKNDVAARFLNSGRLTGEFIEYSRGEERLILPQNAVSAIRENNGLIKEAIYHRWAQILEKYNISPRLQRKIRFIDTDEPRDHPLSFYIKYLDLENPSRLCFFCGQPVQDVDLSIGHIIPWAYLFSDDIWNLAYQHEKCQSERSGQTPPEFFIARLEKRNRALLEKLAPYTDTDMVAGTLKDAVARNLARKHWVCCQ